MKDQGSLFGPGTENERMRRAIALYDDGYYEKKLKEGQEFEDYLLRNGRLARPRPLVITPPYRSQKYQFQFGENSTGDEVKRDGIFRQSQHLYIEYKEKSHPSKRTYVNSGILRNGVTRYIIGDERTVWVFDVITLRDRRDPHFYGYIVTETSIGFRLPIWDANRLGHRYEIDSE